MVGELGVANGKQDETDELARVFAEEFGIQATFVETEQLDHYALLRELGGGPDRVYSAFDPESERQVAIKILRELDDPRVRARWVREAEAMTRMDDPNVVRIHEVGEAEAGPYIVMEWVQGPTLGAWLREGTRSLAEIFDVIRAAGRGLAAIHAAGLVHGNVGPDNIMIAGDGRVRVMDLGVGHGDVEAQEPYRASAGADTLLSMPYYRAPEQLDARPITPRADQYSLCAVLWEAVYGERPFAGSSALEVADAVRTGRRATPAQPERAPAWLHAVLERGLAVEASERFDSMNALVEALGDPASASRKRWLAAAVLSTVVVVFAVWWLSRS